MGQKMKITRDHDTIRNALIDAGLFQKQGAYVLVDGQYGSTGKGLAASFLAEVMGDFVQVVTSNAGPNSGHTSYFGDEKVVLCQLPTMGVMTAKFEMGLPMIYMNAGAIIDIDRLNQEITDHSNFWGVVVDPAAAIVTNIAKLNEQGMHERIGSTGKGTGAALAAKIMRDPTAVADAHQDGIDAIVGKAGGMDRVVFVEVSQGFSLSINAGGMYPYCTSRDCTVAQALSDAGLHPSTYRQSMMVVRTYPIRVAGNSGPCYWDQKETTWDELGQEPEITTVTKKVRRVFTWSDKQFCDAVRANRPDHLFINFMNYLPQVHWPDFVRNVRDKYVEVMGRQPLSILLGTGPKNDDVVMVEDL